MAETNAREGKLYYESYAKAPRSILMARDLSCTQKVILLQLLDRYDYLRNTGKLKDGEPFYMVGNAFEEQTDLTAQTVQRQIIPALIAKGLLSKQRKGVGKNKTYSYYSLDIDAINQHDRAKAKDNRKEDNRLDIWTMGIDELGSVLGDVISKNEALLHGCYIEAMKGNERSKRQELKQILSQTFKDTNGSIDRIADTLISDAQQHNY